MLIKKRKTENVHFRKEEILRKPSLITSATRG